MTRNRTLAASMLLLSSAVLAREQSLPVTLPSVTPGNPAAIQRIDFREPANRRIFVGVTFTGDPGTWNLLSFGEPTADQARECFIGQSGTHPVFTVWVNPYREPGNMQSIGSALKPDHRYRVVLELTANGNGDAQPKRLWLADLTAGEHLVEEKPQLPDLTPMRAFGRAITHIRAQRAGNSSTSARGIVMTTSFEEAAREPVIHDDTPEPNYDGTITGREILTPRPGPAPRMTGARVFGVRPGKPFLFKVTATGQAPLRYGADALPTGLTIDPATGWITGRAPTASGTNTVAVTARNGHGTATRDLRLVVSDTICLTPPMGWNSWYCWSESVSDANVRGTADAMRAKGLVDHGWTYVNIDDCWTDLRDAKTQAIRGNWKFPDMRALADHVHAQGLKFGVYNTVWMSTYAGYVGGSAPNAAADYAEFILPEDQRNNNPAQYFGRYPRGIRIGACRIGLHWLVDVDARQFAAWGVDYVKYDWKEWDLAPPNARPRNDKGKTDAVTRRFHEAFRDADRDIVLSLSPRTDPKDDALCARYANLWRLTGDIHAQWNRMIAPFGLADRYVHTRPGCYGDLDMLQIGKIGKTNSQNRELRPSPLTPAEQYLQVSLWCLLAQPLLLSCDIASMEDFTLGLITNDEVLQVDQDPLCVPARRIANQGGQFEVWSKPLEDSTLAVGLFNLSTAARSVSVTWEQLGIAGKHTARDLWRQKDIGTFDPRFTARVSPHGAVLLRLSKAGNATP